MRTSATSRISSGQAAQQPSQAAGGNKADDASPFAMLLASTAPEPSKSAAQDQDSQDGKPTDSQPKPAPQSNIADTTSSSQAAAPTQPVPVKDAGKGDDKTGGTDGRIDDKTEDKRADRDKVAAVSGPGDSPPMTILALQQAVQQQPVQQQTVQQPAAAPATGDAIPAGGNATAAPGNAAGPAAPVVTPPSGADDTDEAEITAPPVQAAPSTGGAMEDVTADAPVAQPVDRTAAGKPNTKTASQNPPPGTDAAANQSAPQAAAQNAGATQPSPAQDGTSAPTQPVTPAIAPRPATSKPTQQSAAPRATAAQATATQATAAQATAAQATAAQATPSQPAPSPASGNDIPIPPVSPANEVPANVQAGAQDAAQDKSSDAPAGKHDASKADKPETADPRAAAQSQQPQQPQQADAGQQPQAQQPNAGADNSPAQPVHAANIATTMGTAPHQAASGPAGTPTAVLTQHVQVGVPHQPNLPALAVSIATRIQSGARQFDIRLDPPELGRVEVRLSIDATGKTSAHLTTDQPHTLDLLQKDAPALARTLRDAGLNVAQDGLNFSLRQQSHDGGGAQTGGRGQARAGFHLTATTSLEATPASAPYRAVTNGRLDIRV